MKLDCAGAMQHTFGGKVGFVGSLFCLKRAKRLTNAVRANYSAPFVGDWGDTQQARAAIVVCSSLVLQVPGARYLSQVFKSVVCADAVSMVNHPNGKRSVGVEPCEPVQRVRVKINLHPEVAVFFVQRANWGVNRNAVACFDSPGKYACLRAVMEKFAQTFCGKIGISHAVVPLKQWFGQKPARVDSTSGLRHFNTQED